MLIRCYHGLGDAIQFIRYAPLVRRIARRVIVWAQPELLPLLETMTGIDQLIPLHTGAPDVDFDVDVEVMELPHIFRSTIETLPSVVPYLRVEPEPCFVEDKSKLQVGIVWRCGEWDLNRSVPLELLEPLAAISGATLHIFQRGLALAERPPSFGTVSGDDSVTVAARRIAALDLMISIDSMPAHLAAAMGVPTWTLLQTPADWRWMDNRNNSPWYPTMRLFCQQQAGDWSPVLREVEVELRKVSARKDYFAAAPMLSLA